VELHFEARSSELDSLRWREENTFGMRLSKDAVDSLLSQIDPLQHYSLLRAFAKVSSPTKITDGILFLHHQALLMGSSATWVTAANYNFGTTACSSYKLKPEVRSHPSSKTRSPIKDPEYPIVLDTGASWSVTPHMKDFVGQVSIP
jgi:hypothetical protein